jgi:hypothetical protein
VLITTPEAHPGRFRERLLLVWEPEGHVSGEIACLERRNERRALTDPAVKRLGRCSRAMDRLKIRDGGVDGVILLVADTQRKRRVLAAAPSAFQGFNRDARRVLVALEAGRDPGGNSLIVL